MAKGRIIRGGWTWGGAMRRVGEEVEAPPEQIAAWAADGYVEPLPEPEVETATANPAPERATRPRGGRKG